MQTVGFLANMVVLRVRLPVQPSLGDVVRKTRATVLDALRYQELPYQLVGLSAHPGEGRVEDVVFQLMPEPIEQSGEHGGVRLEGVVPRIGGRFNLELAVVPRADGLRAMLFYRPGRVDAGWAESFLDGYARLAAAAVAAPHQRLAAFPV